MRLNWIIAATILVGLPIDVYAGPFGQAMASVLVWIVFFMVWETTLPQRRLALAACLAIATAGEMFLSLGWGIYAYRLGNIPMFVPPGHVILFYLGMQLADRMPAAVEWAVPAVFVPIVAYFAFYTGSDTMGLVYFAFFLGCMIVSPSRRLYPTMFVLSLSMELYGTWLGNWVWADHIPWLGLTSDNPPLASGAFYCVLDLMVVSVVNFSARKPRLEAQRGFAPGGNLQGSLIPAIASDDLNA
jgi:hypothetical protein